LERRLFTPAGFNEGSTKPLPDWTKGHEELKRRGVTMMILWEEHRADMSTATAIPVSASLRRMASAPLADDAADACGGRQAVRRLGW
jgi:hypothetical protein